VVVTFNYQLGALGFLAHPELSREAGVSGNYGCLDVIAALRRVRDNIVGFGGDPDRVTIYGQSAGAAQVAIMMASPEAQGLFHRAIGGSGGRFEGGLTGGPMKEPGQRGKVRGRVPGQPWRSEPGRHPQHAGRHLLWPAWHVGPDRRRVGP
jgi:hypothetical protein